MQLDVHFQAGRSSFTYRLFFELATRACLEKNNVIDLLCEQRSSFSTLHPKYDYSYCTGNAMLPKENDIIKIGIEEKRTGGRCETRNSRSIKVFCDSLLFSTLRNYESSFTKKQRNKQKKKCHSKIEKNKKKNTRILCETALRHGFCSQYSKACIW